MTELHTSILIPMRGNEVVFIVYGGGQWRGILIPMRGNELCETAEGRESEDGY